MKHLALFKNAASAKLHEERCAIEPKPSQVGNHKTKNNELEEAQKLFKKRQAQIQ